MIDSNNSLPQLPEGWVWTRLGEIAERLQSGGTPSTRVGEYYEGGTIPFVKVEDIVGAKKYLWDTTTRITEKGLNQSSAWLVPVNSLLYSMYASYGIPAINKIPLATNQAIIVFIPPDNLVSTDYVYYCLWNIKPHLRSYIRGTTQDNLNAATTRSLPIPLPPLPEQHRIVAKIEELFTKMDAGVESLKQIKAQLKVYRQAVLKHAFAGKLTKEWREEHKGEMEPAAVLLERIRNERKKNAKGKLKELLPLDTSDLPELPEGWMWTTLGFCSKEIYRYPTFYGMQHLSKGVPVIRGEHIAKDGTISHSWQNYWNVAESVSQSFPRTIVEYGDLIMCVRGSVGKMGFVDEELRGAQVSPNCLRISPFKDFCISRFVLYFLKSVSGQELITRLISATTIQTIKSSLIAHIPVPLPPLPEQGKIVEEIERCFSIADQIEKVVEQNLVQAERLRQSILKRAFEGKLVPQDPNDEPAEKLLERIKAEKAKREGGKKAIWRGRKRLNTIQGRLT